MAKNNRPQNQQEQKVVTKYDKKVQKRKEAQRKAERDKKITVFACIAAAAAIIVIAGVLRYPIIQRCIRNLSKSITHRSARLNLTFTTAWQNQIC